MTRINAVIALFASIALTACSGIKVSSDYDPDVDFGSLETYRWAPDFDPANDRTGVNNDLLHNRIHNAIESQLMARGFRAQDDPTPDVWVAYHIGIERKIQVDTMYNQNAGWGRRSYGYGGGGYGRAQTVVREYEEGTLLIDLLRPGSGELIWRGSGSARLKEKRTPEERTQAIDEVVSAILEQIR